MVAPYNLYVCPFLELYFCMQDARNIFDVPSAEVVVCLEFADPIEHIRKLTFSF